MSFEGIDEVSEAGNQREANVKLSKGWVLLAVVQGTDMNPYSHVKYILGRKKPKVDSMEGVKLGAHATQP